MLAPLSLNRVTLTSAAILSFSTSDMAAQAEYTLTFTISSLSSPTDTLTHDFDVQVIMKALCVGGLAMPAAPNPTPDYLIGAPAITL